ncbi:hypothetical protein [Psychrobacter sp. Ps7]|uniref:hypothetical protein n=1 Tax=Psychrobacter sp. Ps7 TaxID=2790961 RepID=UPI001EDF08DC|nr:hypothetical protein [Psychrobacter sp. Ps7]MCG3872899.1 hypothetical protein [Psychrobacter sp. Ps7]
MNQKQYIRLSIVLAIPTLAFSLYLGQEGIFHRKGQFVQCSVSEDFCSPMVNSSYHPSDRYLRYHVGSFDKFLGLYNINYPIKVYLQHISGDMIDVSNVVDGKILESMDCLIFPDKSISCDGDKVRSDTLTEGSIEFINLEDELAFNNIAVEGKSYFKNYTFIRIIDGFGLFLIFAAPYLIFSWLVHFIIYGAKIGSQKRDSINKL